jgi:hypothetical protein
VNALLSSSIDGRLYGVGLFRGATLGLPAAPNGLASEGEQGGKVRVIPRVCGRVHAAKLASLAAGLKLRFPANIKGTSYAA